MMNFVVIDVETANPDYASICSIGAVRYRDGLPSDEFYTLANPQSPFWNTFIHGISADDVVLPP
ncbi:DNA polymerase III subunit epsilon [Boseongicola aestuarii]|uniref:DNA polymerase III subunit epsilon n=1 Tax=Boseongicola aestuarii TaxID=1470561 RepID=A0A238J4G9_9RHOB|nr:DNA polymerase III subunit epsilon [Boseongicola aestuarii]